jgi:ABC-type bacteriocin/lantibiotic exporter with double-glycine peptidase domain
MQNIPNFPIREQKSDYDCGVAALWCILKYYNKNVSYKNVTSLLKTSPIHGTSVKRFIKVTKRLGLSCDYFRNDISRIKKYIRKEIPIVCLIQNQKELSWYNTWEHGHYVVLIGYARQRLYFFDPATGGIEMISIKKFKKQWHDMSRGVVYKKVAIACKI